MNIVGPIKWFSIFIQSKLWRKQLKFKFLQMSETLFYQLKLFTNTLLVNFSRENQRINYNEEGDIAFSYV